MSIPPGTPDCITGGHFMLRNFQGSVLDVSGAIGPIVAFPVVDLSVGNQIWSWSPSESGWLLVGPLGPVYYNSVFDPINPPPVNPQFMQLFTPSGGTSVGFQPSCSNSTTGIFPLVNTNLVLTAWPSEAGDGASPVTLETYTGRPEQTWTVVALD